jgi:hypothetical protein
MIIDDRENFSREKAIKIVSIILRRILTVTTPREETTMAFTIPS